MKINRLSLSILALIIMTSLISSCKKDLEETIPSAPTSSSDGKMRANLAPKNLYIIAKGSLYSVNSETLTHPTKLGNEWWGAAQTIGEDNGHLYAIQGGKLWHVEVRTKKWNQEGNGNWTNAVGVTGATRSDNQGDKFAQAGDHLWRIDLWGVHHQLGEGGWSGTTAIYYHGSALYVICKGILYKVNPNNGTWKELTGGWIGATAITSTTSYENHIYIMWGNKIMKVDASTGVGKFINNSFNNATSMVGSDGYLYVAANNCLHKLDGEGNKLITNLFWSGITSLGISE